METIWKLFVNGVGIVVLSTVLARLAIYCYRDVVAIWKEKDEESK